MAVSTADILTGLTEPQKQAVTHINGPLLVLAGPGSGKTRVITHRVAHLIESGIAPWNILAITFTNKAAAEMRERISAIGHARGSTVCTFHALAVRLLREFADLAGIAPNFSIYDDADQKTAMRDAIAALELDSKTNLPGPFLARISMYKNDLETPEQVASRASDFITELTARVYTAYQKQLAKNSALDFDDLLMRLALLLRDEPDLRDRLNDRYRYVLVDEYQDTNHCQYQIARGLSLNHSNLCATGDPDQSIYSWRGADIGNILAFEKDYPQATVVRLEENFRSIPEVLSLADELIQANSQRKEKRLFTSLPSGETPTLVEYDTEYAEAAGVVAWAKNLHANGTQYRDVAIFYRVNSMSRILEEALRRTGVPYQIVRGLAFYQRREIKDMIAYLRVLVNHSDEVSLRRIINTPTRGIGTTTIERLFDHATATAQPIWTVLEHPEQVETVRGAAQTKIAAFVELITHLRSIIHGPVQTTMQAVYEQTGLSTSLAREATSDPKENVDELIKSAAEYDAQSEDPSLLDYLQQVALVSDSDAYDAESGCVSLMSLHAAKGLEFPAVCIIGVEDGLIPHIRSKDDPASLEEERRLLFVGITRAKQHLTLACSRNRTIMGASQATIRSEFLRPLTGLALQYESTHAAASDTGDDPYASTDDDATRYDEEPIEFHRGQLVRHPKLGLGRIETIMPSRENSRVVIQFNTGSRKTLVVKYANLEPLDFPD